VNHATRKAQARRSNPHRPPAAGLGASDWHVPRDTRAVYRLLMRRRPLVIAVVDERGYPWIWCRIRARDGRIHHHSLIIDDGCWVRVKSRRV